MSDFLLERVQLDDDVTIGRLSIGGHHICWTCEDPVREVAGQPVAEWKVKGSTAIPVGRYKLERTWSPRFQRTLPLLVDVPGFEGVRIHTGNDADDTEGCILPGLERRDKGVGSSRLAFAEVIKWLDAIERVDREAWIEIRGPGQ
jgi:hypothetical protein